MNYLDVSKDLKKHITKNRKETNERFFKTGKGEYGAHDRFLGILNPDVRKVAKKYKDCDLVNVQKLITSKYNEERLCALVILVERFRSKKINDVTKKQIYNFYLKNLEHINNWNLVDLSAPHIAGEYIADNRKELNILDELAKSNFYWNRRVCILATWAFTKRGEFDNTLRYAKVFLSNDEDLMHKATGWMLREVWKRDNKICEEFLMKNYNELPRVTLRYAIEKMEEQKRKRFLNGKF
ncbi:MAG: DNA alkylation repair protein [Candidatus Moraniibacteriota bacterium]|jgi:3-methyladenine DNA glycosylase AlkD